MQNLKSDTEHETVSKLLPWLVNGTLSFAETQRVETHLQQCPECCSQVAQLRVMNEQVVSETSAWKPTPVHFSTVLSEIDRVDPVAAQQKAGSAVGESGLVRFFQSVFQASSPVRWTLAVESVALIALLVFISAPARQWLSQEDVPYQTLSSPDKYSSTTNIRLRLMTTEAMSVVALTQLLQETKAQLTSGPSPLGFYIVEIPPNKAKEALAIFRNHPAIKYVQRIEVKS